MAVEALDMALWLNQGLKELGVVSSKPVLVTDCKSVRDCAYAPVPSTSERQARIDMGSLIEAVNLNDIAGLVWVDRWRMLADPLASVKPADISGLFEALDGFWTLGLSANAQRRTDTKGQFL